MRAGIMSYTELHGRVFESSDKICFVENKIRSYFLFGYYFFISILLISTSLRSEAMNELGGDASKLFRVFEKTAEHNNGYLYDNSDWSHDGTKIVFMSHDLDAGNTSTIWVYYTEEERLTQVTYPDTVGMMDTMPVWSPDDTQIAFASDRGGSLHVWIIDEDGENMRMVTNELVRNNWVDIWAPKPAWAPDGQHLVFSDEVDGNRDIYRTNLVDGGVVRSMI